MKIMRPGSRPTRAGPSEYFTGSVRFDPVIEAPDPARISALMVTFEPGARTAWHTHPLGQTLMVQTGVGRVQVWGEPQQEIRPGDVVWIPPGVKHWHGAAPDVAMCHMALQEMENGSAADWLEQVTDAQYLDG